MIVVVTRCLNEEKNIERFLTAYNWADKIIVSDGGSADSSLDILNKWSTPRLDILSFPQCEMIGEWKWNPDNPHINYIIDAGKEYCKTANDWIILDDMDDIPNYFLKEHAREHLENTENIQVNAFRLYMWGTDKYFPQMNNYFDPLYTSLWAWKPNQIDIHADNNMRHGTIVGLANQDRTLHLSPPNCLLHYSWSPETIESKVRKYNDIGLPMNHPFEFAGEPTILPDWAKV